ncbi:MAG: FAD-dependent monooxygenase [Myxococcota bacterium]
MALPSVRDPSRIDFRALQADLHGIRQIHNVAANQPGDINSMQLLGEALSDAYFDSPIFGERLAYGAANPYLSVDEVVNDVQRLLTDLVGVQRNPGQRLAMNDVVIVGAGPAGLGIAIALKHLGVENVTVVDRYRPLDEVQQIRPIFNMRPSGMTDLRELGVLDPLLQKSGAIAKAAFHNAIDGVRVSLEPVHSTNYGLLFPDDILSACDRGFSLDFNRGDDRHFPTPISHPAATQMRRGDMVYELAAEAKRLGVRFLQDATAKIDSEDGGQTLTVSCEAEGRMHDLGQPDQVVLATGSLKRFDIPGANTATRAESPTQQWIGGLTDHHEVGPTIHRMTRAIGGETARGIAIGHARKEHLWGLTQVPAGIPLQNTEQIRGFWATQLHELLSNAGINASITGDRIIEGADRVFEVRLDRLLDTTLGLSRIKVVGDAADKGHFLTSFGVHAALGAHRQAIELFFTSANTVGMNAAQWLFKKTMGDGADYWNGGSFDEFFTHDRPANLRGLLDPNVPRPADAVYESVVGRGLVVPDLGVERTMRQTHRAAGGFR